MIIPPSWCTLFTILSFQAKVPDNFSDLFPRRMFMILLPIRSDIRSDVITAIAKRKDIYLNIPAPGDRIYQDM